jgi:hypothetical protein
MTPGLARRRRRECTKMGIFSRRRDTEEQDRHRADAECHHRTLLPRWDRPEDMGREDLASTFQCSSCNQMFSPDEAKALRDTAQRTIHETITN